MIKVGKVGKMHDVGSSLHVGMENKSVEPGHRRKYLFVLNSTLKRVS